MNVIYLSDVVTLQKILKKGKNYLDNFTFMTSSIEVAYILEELKITFIDVQSFLTFKDILKNKKIVHKLSKDFFVESKINSLLQAELIYPLETALNARTVFNKIFKKYKFELIEAYVFPKEAVIRTGPTPVSEALFSISESILCSLAKLEKIQLNLYEIKRKKRFIDFAKLIASNKLKSDQSFKRLNENKLNNIIIYETNMQRDEVDIISRKINLLKKFNIIYLNQNILDGLLSLAIRDHCYKFLYEKIKKEYQVKYKDILKPLDFQFEKFASELNKCNDHAQVIERLFSILNPKLLILGHDTFAVEKNLVTKAREKKIKCISLIHTGVGYNFHFNSLTGLSDKLIVWNRGDYNNLIRFKTAKSRLLIIGSLQYELYKKNLNLSFKCPDSSLIKFKYGLEQKSPIILILTAEISTAFTSHVANLKKHRDAIRSIVKIARENKKINFVFKPHPAYDYHEIYSHIEKASNNIYYLPKANLDEILLVTDLSLLINYATTAVVHSLYKRVPIIFYCNAQFKANDWRDNLLNLPIERIKKYNKLSKTISNFQHLKHLSDEDNYFNSSLSKILNISEYEKYPSEKFINFIVSSIKFNGKLNKNKFNLNKIITKIHKQKQLMKFRFISTDFAHISFYDWHFIAYLLGAFKIDNKIIWRLCQEVAFEKASESLRYSKFTLYIYYIMGFASSNQVSLLKLVKLFKYFFWRPFAIFNVNKFMYKSIFMSQLKSKLFKFYF